MSNTRDSNAGNYNAGYYNTGYYNAGYYNTGNRNSGNKNPGYYNAGNYNSGNNNAGNYNSGNWNSCDYETGHLNTIESGDIRVFNKPCSGDLWAKAKKPSFFYFDLTQWVPSSKMTSYEKGQYPSHTTTGGYLKTLDYKETWQASWDKASDDDKALLYKLPNFDAEVFKELTGIDVEAKESNFKKEIENLVAEFNGRVDAIVKKHGK